MHKVLIVDDEHIIREGLKTIIDWESFGFEVCGTAVNGKEGLQEAERQPPDLIIADIKMPVMNGLEMVEELNKRGIDSKVIILTAHSDFGFAQKSVELGIDSYVVKPVEQNDLIEKVKKVRAEIETKKEIRQYLNDSILLSRGKILEGYVRGEIPESMAEKHNKQYNLDFPWEKYQVGLIDFCKDDALPLSARNEIRGFTESFILQNGYGYVFDIDGYIGILLKNIQEILLPRLLMRLQSKVYSDWCVRLTISAGNPVSSLSEASSSYLDARRLLENKFLLGHKEIIISRDDGGDRMAPGNSRPYCFNMEETLNNLQNAIDVNHPDHINDLLEEMKNCFLRSGLDEKAVKINYTCLYLSLINRMEAADSSMRSRFTDKEEVLDQIGKQASLQELHGFMKHRLFSLSDRLSYSRPAGTMKKILDYIDRNYARDIKLESLAAMFCYNSTYLGKLFKSHTGCHFNTYLDRVRMEKAKHFLGKGLKVYHVVEMVGIHDIDYFYRKFKKYTGQSPSAFKGKGDCAQP